MECPYFLNRSDLLSSVWIYLSCSIWISKYHWVFWILIKIDWFLTWKNIYRHFSYIIHYTQVPSNFISLYNNFWIADHLNLEPTSSINQVHFLQNWIHLTYVGNSDSTFSDLLLKWFIMHSFISIRHCVSCCNIFPYISKA